MKILHVCRDWNAINHVDLYRKYLWQVVVVIWVTADRQSFDPRSLLCAEIYRQTLLKISKKCCPSNNAIQNTKLAQRMDRKDRRCVVHENKIAALLICKRWWIRSCLNGLKKRNIKTYLFGLMTASFHIFPTQTKMPKRYTYLALYVIVNVSFYLGRLSVVLTTDNK